MQPDDIRARAYAMPFTSPAYPAGPYRYRDRETLTIAYRSDAAALEHAVPEPLRLAAAEARCVFTRMPDSTGFGHYSMCTQSIPVLLPEMVRGAVFEPDAADLDVHAIHQGYLRGLRRAGGTVVCGAELIVLKRSAGLWQALAGGTTYAAPVLLNAAGAWADVVAGLADVPLIGLEPRRRRIWPPPIGPWPSALPRTGISSPMPACCWAHRPMPIRLNHRTFSRRRWILPSPSTGLKP